MARIKFTKGELKKQRDSLRQYERFLPTLQLKKQQLQMEILHQGITLEEKRRLSQKKKSSISFWAGLLAEKDVEIKKLVVLKMLHTDTKNIAGVDIPVFNRTEFDNTEYDLFVMPLWVDAGAEALKELISLNQEIQVIERGIEILRQELRITTQRVNLFEKVKIPEAKEFIRLIKIYLGDQMTNAVGRSKIAKRKIEEAMLEEAMV